MTVLQLSVHFHPNIGGVETHLNDLINALIKRNWMVSVLTYRPLTTKVGWKIYEKSKNIEILRIPWLPNLFYKLISYPILEFIYLLPGLFLVAPFVIIFKKIDLIHAHGLVAGFVGVFWGRLFGKRVVISTHSIYHFPKGGLYKKFARWIFNNANFCLGLSKQAEKEIKSLGISSKKVGNFTYWIDLETFRKKAYAKKILGWEQRLVVLFVGRLVEEKGIAMLLESAKSWDKGISLIIIGSGPMEKEVKIAQSIAQNVEYIGLIDQSKLPLYYSGSDVLIVPSDSEEGFGRVILESLACELPIIGASRGAIPEAIDETVGKLIEVSPQNIKNAVEFFLINPDALKKLRVNCRKFAERRYSEKNAEKIIEAYRG